MPQFDESFKGPLDGVTVLDLSRLVAGNMVSLQLADYGAEVIKIEPAAKGDPLRHWVTDDLPITWKVYGRNKKSVSLDLRQDEAKDILLRLVEQADVMIENYRPGTLEKMGLGPDVLHARNAGLILVRVSGFGQTGPYKHKPGFGTLVETMSGFAYRNGFEDREPVLPPLAMADMIAGLSGAMSVLIALREREVKGGDSQVIDLSLLKPIFSILGAEPAWHQVTGQVRDRVGSGSNTASPRNVYATKDGKWLAMSGSMQSMAERIFRVIGRADMIDDPKYLTNADRVENRLEVDEIVGGWIGERTLDECMEIFDQESVTVAPVYDIEQIMADKHFREREVIVDMPDEEMGTVAMHNITPRLSGTPGGFARPAPSLGQHNAEILGRIGIGEGDLTKLKDQGVI